MTTLTNGDREHDPVYLGLDADGRAVLGSPSSVVFGSSGSSKTAALNSTTERFGGEPLLLLDLRDGPPAR